MSLVIIQKVLESEALAMAEKEGLGTKRTLIQCLAKDLDNILQLLNTPYKPLNEPIQVESQIQ